MSEQALPECMVEEQGIVPCPQLPCPCSRCNGPLAFTGPNVTRDLVFMECENCGCAFVAPVAPEGLRHLTDRSTGGGVDEHH